VGLVHTHFAFN